MEVIVLLEYFVRISMFYESSVVYCVLINGFPLLEQIHFKHIIKSCVFHFYVLIITFSWHRFGL